jgi:hypothetical protein
MFPFKLVWFKAVILAPLTSGAASILNPSNPWVAFVNPANSPIGMLGCSVEILAVTWIGYRPVVEIR